MEARSYEEWQRREEARETIDEAHWDLQQPLQPLKRLVAGPHVAEWGCECVQVDADVWDARNCPEHGNPEAQKEQEAAEQIAYYAVDPEEKQYDRFRLTPSGEMIETKKEEAA